MALELGVTNNTFRRDSVLFGKGFRDGEAAKRLTALLMNRGLQTRGYREMNLGRALGQLDD
jgi:hypothetical protein